MSLHMERSPTTEDVRKLHHEVNQIMAQRFTITTFAFVVFGVMLGWLSSKDPPANGASLDQTIVFLSIALNVVLYVLFRLHLNLKLYARVLTSYLLESGASQWEIDWQKYRKSRFEYRGYTRPQVTLFMLLTFITMLYPEGVILLYRPEVDFSILLLVLLHIVLSSIFLCIEWQSGLKDRQRGYEELVRSNWREILHKSQDRSEL